MIKWIYKISFLILALAISININAAPIVIKKKITKTIHESFEVDADAHLGVHNKYGNISITTWDRNTIEVDVLIKVNSSSESKGQTFLDGMKIDISASRSKVGMKTEFPDQENSSWWGSWWNNSDNIDFEVHYDIKAPEGISSTLINKYGNVTQVSIKGSTNVTNKYGDIFLDAVGEDLNLHLGYGKAKVARASNVEVEIKNGSFRIGDCGDVSMTSKYSDFSFGNVEHMTLTSKYDEFSIESAKSIVNSGKYDSFKIGEVDQMKMDTKNTSLQIDVLHERFRIDTKYGSVKINSTTGDVERISLDSKYTSYRIGVDADFHLSFIGDKADLDIDVPHDTYGSYSDGNDKEVKAYRGNKKAKLKIDANLKYGGLLIKNNR